MNNISGNASSWVTDSQSGKKSKKVEEVIVEYKEMDKKSLKNLIDKLHVISTEMNEIYGEFPMKYLSDSHIMLHSAIRSLENNYSKN